MQTDGGARISCRKLRSVPALVCGDRIEYRYPSPSAPVIVRVEDRKSLLARHAARGGVRPIAANIDLVCVVAAPKPATSVNLIDKYLAVAEYQEIESILLFSKTDLWDKPSRKKFSDMERMYREIGYEVYLTAAKTGDVPEEMRKRLAPSMTVFVGQSGVGKSTLIGAIAGVDDIVTGSLMASGLGRHTTSTTSLYTLPGGGSIIDSPGVRNFATWHIPAAELPRQFPEFRPFLDECRFRDCAHEKEPGCAVVSAVEGGRISYHRWRSYLHCKKESNAL